MYLFFTVVSSEQYMGVAQMVSEVDSSKSFGFWWENAKWPGMFRIKWVYVKDIAYSAFSSIYFGDKPVCQHRDGTKLDFDTGVKMLRLFEKTPTTESIFKEMKYMDDREEKLRMERQMLDYASNDGYVHKGGRDHRAGRDKDYRKKEHKYSSEYQPRKRDAPRRDNRDRDRERDQEERDERSEEPRAEIVIQKKGPNNKKKRTTKPTTQASDAKGESKVAEEQAPAKASNKDVDLPPTEA